jgi:3-deoxy-7-phosphoheptulonate synthase
VSNLPPLIQSKDVDRLNTQLNEVASSQQRFILQVGDCVATFKDCSWELVSQKLSLFMGMKTVLEKRLK